MSRLNPQPTDATQKATANPLENSTANLLESQRASIASLPTQPWARSSFDQEDQDPLTGFANIMDVMLVFALGLMVALLAQQPNAQFNVQTQASTPTTMDVTQGKEMTDVPEHIKQALQQQAGEGMEAVGQVFRDPKTGKLILIGQ